MAGDLVGLDQHYTLIFHISDFLSTKEKKSNRNLFQLEKFLLLVHFAKIYVFLIGTKARAYAEQTNHHGNF